MNLLLFDRNRMKQRNVLVNSFASRQNYYGAGMTGNKGIEYHPLQPLKNTEINKYGTVLFPTLMI